jgi:hypothetical protein
MHFHPPSNHSSPQQDSDANWLGSLTLYDITANAIVGGAFIADTVVDKGINAGFVGDGTPNGWRIGFYFCS